MYCRRVVAQIALFFSFETSMIKFVVTLKFKLFTLKQFAGVFL